jgi:signal transduction histidine kinase
MRGCALTPWPRRRSPLRTELAAFIRSHAAEVVSEWTARIAPVFDIQASLMPEISQNMYDALVRWAKHIEDPSNTETYAYLYQHARHGFISHSPASRFLSGQMKIRLLLLERLQTAYAADRKRLAELAGLLDQEFSERILHITDFFVEAHEEALRNEQETHKRLESQLIQSEKMAAIGQLAAGIAHEIRNPLGIILNAIYDLGQIVDTDKPEIGEDLQIAKEEIARAQEIITNLLEFSRDSGTELEAVDLNDLLRKTLQLMQKYLANHHVTVETAWGEVGTCFANQNALRQVFLNLITNAVQAMPRGGQLRVRTQRHDPTQVRIEFGDTGVGIAQEHLTDIFNPFFTTKEPGQGTGLGLSVVHSVLKRYQGNITVRSEPERGTTFLIDLPCPCHQDAAALSPADVT